MKTLAERIVGYLNGFEGRLCDFLPEAVEGDRETIPAAGVFFVGDMKETQFLDGSMRLEIPFQIRLRVKPVSARERLNAFSSLIGLWEYMRVTPFRESLDGGETEKITPKGMPTGSAASDNGSEELRMDFAVELRLFAPANDGEGQV